MSLFLGVDIRIRVIVLGRLRINGHKKKPQLVWDPIELIIYTVGCGTSPDIVMETGLSTA
jgi:hypothetical protein